MKLKYCILSSFYFEVIIGQSAVDVITTLIYNMKKTFNKKYIFTTLAFDIERVFDKMIEKQLIKQLYKQNVPLLLIC